MTRFERFQPTLFEFLEQLDDNNNRPWFQENKSLYERDVMEPAMAFIRAFQPRLKRITPYFLARDRRVGGSLMRVYRDTRFAKGEPCKTKILGHHPFLPLRHRLLIKLPALRYVELGKGG